jgi:hypothetical protein
VVFDGVIRGLFKFAAITSILLSLGVFASPPPDIVGETPVVTEVSLYRGETKRAFAVLPRGRTERRDGD